MIHWLYAVIVLHHIEACDLVNSLLPGTLLLINKAVDKKFQGTALNDERWFLRALRYLTRCKTDFKVCHNVKVTLLSCESYITSIAVMAVSICKPLFHMLFPVITCLDSCSYMKHNQLWSFNIWHFHVLRLRVQPKWQKHISRPFCFSKSKPADLKTSVYLRDDITFFEPHSKGETQFSSGTLSIKYLRQLQ